MVKSMTNFPFFITFSQGSSGTANPRRRAIGNGSDSSAYSFATLHARSDGGLSIIMLELQYNVGQ